MNVLSKKVAGYRRGAAPNNTDQTPRQEKVFGAALRTQQCPAHRAGVNRPGGIENEKHILRHDRSLP
jgi:hypothetical protein